MTDVTKTKASINSQRYLVSLDAHKRTYFAKIVDSHTDKIFFNSGIVGTIKNVIDMLELLKLPKKETTVLYEAGCVGFHPYWQLRDAGYECLVIAPSSIPRNNRLRKSDKNDCSNNLHYHMSGLLRYVTVPERDSCHIRELNRYRDGLVDKLRKQKQLINAFTLRHGYIFDGTKNDWSIAHIKWLRGLKLAPTLQITLQLLLEEFDSINNHIAKCEKETNSSIKARPNVENQIEKFKLLPGIGPVTAQTIVLECGELGRFGRPDQLSRFIGITPGMQQSGESKPVLAITKEGNEFARRMVISASKFYGDRRCLYSEKELLLLPEKLAVFIRKMQDRLNSRYRHLRGRGKHINKVRCAIARELIMFLWEYSIKVIPELESGTIKSKRAA
jgi:transposase